MVRTEVGAEVGRDLVVAIRREDRDGLAHSGLRDRGQIFVVTLLHVQRLLRASGFAAEADQAEQSHANAALRDRVLDAICLIGPVTH